MSKESLKTNMEFFKCETEIKNETPDNNFSPELRGILDEGSKCGDVFLYLNRKFMFSCYFCSDKFTEFGKFTDHIVEVHSKVLIRDYDEDICSDDQNSIPSSPAEPSIRDAEEISLDNSNLASVNRKDIDDESHDRMSTKENNEYQCDECERKFNTVLGLKRHHSRTHGKATVNEDAKPSKTEAPQKRKRSNTRSLKCRFCERMFQHPSQRVAHERIHTGELPYKCSVCSKCFRITPQLNEHMLTHNGIKPHKCTHCPVAFTNRWNLVVHIRRAHLGEKRYKCDFCEMRFVTNPEKRKHMRLHTGEKPFQCEECGAKFKASTDLNQHKHISHLKSRRYGCTVCEKKFSTRSCLKDHLAGHSDARPFGCETCAATFPRRKALMAHMKLHSAIKEYSCKLCGKEFAQSAGLYSHMKSHRIDGDLKIKESINCSGT